MKVVSCPHCGSQRIVIAKVPKDVVVVQPCPVCHEFVVLFRRKVIALNRAILEKGSFDERKAHIAEIIAEFLEPDLFAAESVEEDASPFDGLFRQMAEAEDGAPGDPGDEAGEADEAMDDAADDDADEEDDEEGISDEEVDRFVRVELKKLDDPRYFRKHFG